MKIRIGFVSNSSSASFICAVCQHSHEGHEASLDDAGMVRCVNNHEFCEEHMLVEFCSKEHMNILFYNPKSTTCRGKMFTLSMLEDNSTCGDFIRRRIPESACPICQE